MRPVRPVLLVGLAAVLAGCQSGAPPERPPKPVVAWVTLRVPKMT